MLASTSWAAIGAEQPRWHLEPRDVGLSGTALRLPDRVSPSQNSRGWQYATAPATAGEPGVLAASDGLYWDFELRTLVTKEGRAAPFVGCVFRYEDSNNYSTLVWDTGAGELALRSLRPGHAPEATRARADFGGRTAASIVLRVVMGKITVYVNGEKVLSRSQSSLLGRVAVFAVGRAAPELDGLEVRSLRAREADSDVFGRGRKEYETLCASCHDLDGPWNSNYAPDDWESVVDEMLDSEGADEFIAPEQARRITDYLRLISLHPDRNRYQPLGHPISLHPDSPSSPPLRPSHVRLKHQKPGEIVALFARERIPSAPGEHLPRAARSDSAESLLPPGVEAVLPAADPQQLVVVGTEAHPSEVRDCIAVLDAPVESTGPGRVKVVLTLRHGDPGRVRYNALRLPGAGSAAVSGRRVTLEGTPTWLHRTLRQVIRAELKEAETLGVPER